MIWPPKLYFCKKKKKVSNFSDTFLDKKQDVLQLAVSSNRRRDSVQIACRYIGDTQRVFSSFFLPCEEKRRSLWKTTVISMSKKLQQEDHDITWFWNATEMRDARQSPPLWTRIFLLKNSGKQFQVWKNWVMNHDMKQDMEENGIPA